MIVPAPRKSIRLSRLFPGVLVLAAACGGGSGEPTPTVPDPPADVPVVVPSRGTDASFDVATWNVEWFGDPGRGPSDDLQQLRRVRDVIGGAEIDVWGVQEITDGTDFDALLQELPEYEGVLADDPVVQGGAASYSDFDGNEQKVGVIWRRSEVELIEADVVLTEYDYEFAGRPPLRLRMRSGVDGAEQDYVILVLHAKASTDQESWERRAAGAVALKAFLDLEHGADRVVVLGDFNDDLDESIRAGSPTPYGEFIDDRNDWRFVTEVLTAAGETSTIGYDDVIDHVLVSDEVDADYVTGSAEVFRLDAIISGFGDSTSDHFPVLARFQPGG